MQFFHIHTFLLYFAFYNSHTNSCINLWTDTISFTLYTLLPQNNSALSTLPSTAFINAFVIQYGVLLASHVFMHL